MYICIYNCCSPFALHAYEVKRPAELGLGPIVLEPHCAAREHARRVDQQLFQLGRAHLAPVHVCRSSHQPLQHAMVPVCGLNLWLDGVYASSPVVAYCGSVACSSASGVPLPVTALISFLQSLAATYCISGTSSSDLQSKNYICIYAVMTSVTSVRYLADALSFFHAHAFVRSR